MLFAAKSRAIKQWHAATTVTFRLSGVSKIIAEKRLTVRGNYPLGSDQKEAKGLPNPLASGTPFYCVRVVERETLCRLRLWHRLALRFVARDKVERG